MTINRDPDGKATVPPGLTAEARRNGWTVFAVTLFSSGSTEDAADGVQFYVMAPAIPRLGEAIYSQDGERCKVVGIQHRIGAVELPGGGSGFVMVPQVAALQEPEDDDE